MRHLNVLIKLDVREFMQLYSSWDFSKSGTKLFRYCGTSYCRFGCGISEDKMGSADLSDGVWQWPEGLVHYLEVHRVALPDEFIKHILGDKNVE